MFNAVIFAALGYLIGNEGARKKVEKSLLTGFKNGISKIQTKVIENVSGTTNNDEFNPINTEKI